MHLVQEGCVRIYIHVLVFEVLWTVTPYPQRSDKMIAAVQRREWGSGCASAWRMGLTP
jgi:hypothetical protein